jgi:hypothetical protein
MSGTSWFDLGSIQDQINKSIQEAAKIAEEASKYDILNFDGMAEQDEDEEREYDSEEEELQIPSTKNNDIDTNYAAKTQRSPDTERNVFRSENINQTPVAHRDSSPPISSTHHIVKTESSINKSVSFDCDDDDFLSVVNGRSDVHMKAGDIQLPSSDLGTPYTPVHPYTPVQDYGREREEDHHDKESSDVMLVSATNGLLGAVPIPHIVPSTSLPLNGDTPDLVSDASSPKKAPSKNVDGVQKPVKDRNEHEFHDTGSDFQEISLKTENKQKGDAYINTFK